MAASKDLIVSNGLSHLLRVGFDRSGSAVVDISQLPKTKYGDLEGIPIALPWVSRYCIARMGASEDFTPLATAAVKIISPFPFTRSSLRVVLTRFCL